MTFFPVYAPDFQVHLTGVVNKLLLRSPLLVRFNYMTPGGPFIQLYSFGRRGDKSKFGFIMNRLLTLLWGRYTNPR